MDLDELLSINGGVASRHDLTVTFGRAWTDNEVRRGRLVAIFPRAYARPWDVDLPEVRLYAAVTSVGGSVALSQLTALERHHLPVPPGSPLHVTAYQARHPRGVPGELVVHRTLLPLRAEDCDGLPVVRPEVAAVTSWPLLSGSDQRAPLIHGFRRGLLREPLLRELAETSWWIPGIGELRALTRDLLAGCESELELFGHRQVFDVPGLDHARRQRIIQVGDRTFRLDLAYEQEQVAVELDGRAYHASPQQWERDIERDLLVATVGWQTIRFSHRRLTTQAQRCRDATSAVLAARRHRLAS